MKILFLALLALPLVSCSQVQLTPEQLETLGRVVTDVVISNSK